MREVEGGLFSRGVKELALRVGRVPLHPRGGDPRHPPLPLQCAVDPCPLRTSVRPALCTRSNTLPLQGAVDLCPLRTSVRPTLCTRFGPGGWEGPKREGGWGECWDSLPPTLGTRWLRRGEVLGWVEMCASIHTCMHTCAHQHKTQYSRIQMTYVCVRLHPPFPSPPLVSLLSPPSSLSLSVPLAVWKEKV